MQSMTAHEAKARFGQLLDAARDGPVAISKHGRDVAVLISIEEFDAMAEARLQTLKAEIQKGFDSIAKGRFEDIEAGELASLGAEIKALGRKRQKKK